MRSRQDKCFSRMGLRQLRPEETASHDLELFYHVARGVGSHRRCEAHSPGVAGAASGKRRAMRVANTKTELDRFVATLRAFDRPCEIAFEPTGDYHRPLAYVLGQAGFHLCLVSSIAVARTREALYNSGTRTTRRTHRSFCISSSMGRRSGIWIHS